MRKFLILLPLNTYTKTSQKPHTSIFTLSILLLLVCILYQTGAFHANKLFAQNSKQLSSSLSYEKIYNQALDLHDAYKYQEAISLFESLLKRNPQNHLSDNCQYWIGECYYGMKNFNTALREFRKVYQFPDGNKYAVTQFKIGLCYRYMGDRAKEIEELQKFIDFYPSDSNVKKAAEFISRPYQAD